MNKEQVKKIARKIIKSAEFGPKDYRPPHAVWFQKQDDLRAFVSFINNKYHWEIYKETDVFPKLMKMRPHGKKLEEGDEKTLALAKKEVFKYFDKNK